MRVSLIIDFLPYISQFFDETTFCSTGYTASESLRTSACSIVADYVHNIRKQLSYEDICKAITYFSKSLHDPLLHINLQHMCCRVLLNLIDCIKSKDQENAHVNRFNKHFKWYFQTWSWIGFVILKGTGIDSQVAGSCCFKIQNDRQISSDSLDRKLK